MVKRKQKPDWAISKVSWKTKKAIWLRWSLGEKDADIIRYLELNKKKYPDSPDHRDTIRVIRNELPNMPVDVIRKLIKQAPEIRSFIEKLRPELKDELELPTGTDAKSHDREIFKKSDSIINEEEVQSFLDNLEFHNTYHSSTRRKLIEFKKFFLSENNKYVDNDLTSLIESLVKSLSKIIRFSSSFFKPMDNVETKDSHDDNLFMFDPQNRYPRERGEYIKDLLELTNSVRETYSAYRAAIRQRLFI